MPFPSLQHHGRSHSNTHTPEAPAAAGSALIHAAQTLTGIGAPVASVVQQQQQLHQQHQLSQHQQHLQQPGGSSGSLRLQTSQNNLASNGPGSGKTVTPIYSGSTVSGGALSSTSTTGLGFSNRDTSLEQQKKQGSSFQLPSPTEIGRQGDLYNSPQELHPLHRPTDPVQAQQIIPSGNSSQSHLPQQLQQQPQQQYQAYHSVQSSSNTGSRPQPQPSHTAPGSIPQIINPSQQQQSSMHRTNTTSSSYSHSSKYSPQLNPSASVSHRDPAGSAGGDSGRKYTHPGALTPTYPQSAQHSSSHSHSGAAHLGMGLAGLSSPGASVREREDVIGGIGAVGNGKWMSPWSLFALDWCKWQPTSGGYGRIAVGSYAEDSHNYIQIFETRPAPASGSHSDTPPPAPSIEFSKLAEASHTYPITRILWEPANATKPLTELLATSGDHLRLWSLPTTTSASSSTSATPSGNSIHRSNTYQTPTQKLTPLALLSNSKSTDFTAPLTSLDWNPITPSLIITSSIDTTCTIWDIPTLTAKTQLIAHDKEVFDVRFMSGSVDVFASCGADGSVRMFDLRSLEHSTIIYEPGVGKGTGSDPNTSKEDGGSPVGGVGTSPPPLLRLAASPHDAHLIATFSQDSNLVRILDVRQPGQALVELKGHSSNVNCIEWNPTRRGIIAGGADDSLVLIWDLVNNTTSSQPGGSNGTGVTQEKIPVASWRCEYEVNNISWSPSSSSTAGGGIGDWLGVVGGRGLWGVKI